ncbi:MAG: hypothetical protein M1818_003421 [Claussenomyces sp. TS43310]|nr:MAG: hypothetical protein M1818_003421 [Claussenomyces sp. TS43310]
MSLLHRVSSFDSFASSERGRTLSGPSHGHRKLSFSPLPGAWDPPQGDEWDEDQNAIGAFEVPKAKRLLQVFTAVVYCLFAAGIVFGYAALKPVLIRENVYRDLCTQDELDRHVRTCYSQETHLNLMFTIAAVGTNVAALPIGAILDRYGPRTCGIVGSFLLAAGALFFAFAWQMPFDTYVLGYLLLALGGPHVFISSFQLSNAFPQHSGLILALLTGAFDTSSAIFLIYRLVYQSSGGAFKPKYFFLGYLIVPALIFIVQTTLMPKMSYKTIGEIVKDVRDVNDLDPVADDQFTEHDAFLRDERRETSQAVPSEITSLLGGKAGGKQVQEEEKMQKVSGVWGVLHGESVKDQILSPWFILITLFTVIQMTRINFFVATIRPQYEYLLHSYDKAVEINDYFDLALPLGGVLSIPFIGLVLDNTSTLFVLSALVTIATTIGVLGILPYTWAAYANVALFVLYRPFYYTAVSDYSAKVFGFRTFGTVYGLIICLAGLGNLSQSGLDALLHKVCRGNPVPVNLGLLLGAFVVGIALCSFVGVKAYGMERDALEEEAEDAGETIMPGAQSPERLRARGG